jgi:hypothetical protein
MRGVVEHGVSPVQGRLGARAKEDGRFEPACSQRGQGGVGLPLPDGPGSSRSGIRGHTFPALDGCQAGQHHLPRPVRNHGGCSAFRGTAVPAGPCAGGRWCSGPGQAAAAGRSSIDRSGHSYPSRPCVRRARPEWPHGRLHHSSLSPGRQRQRSSVRHEAASRLDRPNGRGGRITGREHPSRAGRTSALAAGKPAAGPATLIRTTSQLFGGQCHVWFPRP